jgi:hypothetical protein
MPVLPLAAFLAGALLSLLLPTILLIALVVWYWAFIRRVPESSDVPDAPTAASADPATPSPGQSPPSA